MMKKMLVLALVLAVAGLANAGLSLVGPSTAMVGETVEFKIVNGATTQISDGYMFVVTGASYNVDTAMNYYNAGGVADGFVVPIDETTVFFDFAKSGSPIPTIPDNLLVADKIFITFATEGTANLVLSDIQSYGQAADVSSLDVVVTAIPEPMTMVLLGLGGLFLRKRK